MYGKQHDIFLNDGISDKYDMFIADDIHCMTDSIHTAEHPSLSSGCQDL